MEQVSFWLNYNSHPLIISFDLIIWRIIKKKYKNHFMYQLLIDLIILLN